MQYLLLLHGKNGYAKAPYYVFKHIASLVCLLVCWLACYGSSNRTVRHVTFRNRTAIRLSCGQRTNCRTVLLNGYVVISRYFCVQVRELVTFQVMA
jgi:hypothetical protein